MSESARMWTEVGFNCGYLICVWGLVAAMTVRLPAVGAGDRRVAGLLRNGLLLLALGDTGHVGFRVLAYALGGLDRTIDLGGWQLPLVGAGALATAITVTLLYLLLLELWRVRFERGRGAGYWLLVGCAVLRFALFVPPQNQWGAVVPPFDWSLLRNLPLTVLGLGVAGLLLVDGRRARDRASVAMAICICCSYAFYLPVILFVQRAPLIGMLMIPKTLAYLALAWIGFRAFFRRPRPA